MRILQWIASVILFPLTLHAQEKSLYLNPDNALGAKPSTFFSGIDLIQLETTKNSFVNNITSFVVTPMIYALCDQNTNTILLFSKEGKFLYNYKKKQHTISELQYVPETNSLFIVWRNKNYTIPPAKAQQMIEHPGKRNFSKYVSLELLSLNSGDNFKVQKLPVPPNALNKVEYFQGKLLAQSPRYNKYILDTIAYHLSVIDGIKVTKKYYPYLNIEKLPSFYEDIFFATAFSQNDASLLINKNFDNTIYRLTKDSLTTAYKFIFPSALAMPAEFQSTLFKNNIEYTGYKNKYPKAFTSFYDIIEQVNLLFFSASANNNQSKNFLYNSNNNNLYDLSKVPTDSSIYFLPSKIFTNINSADKDYVYTIISNAELIKEKNNILSKYKMLPESVKKIMDGLNKFNNPVIIKLKTNTVPNL